MDHVDREEFVVAAEAKIDQKVYRYIMEVTPIGAQAHDSWIRISPASASS